MEKNIKPKIVLIDANAIVHRAFHALPPLATEKGELVNAVYGFTTMLLKVLDDLKPDYIAVAYDKPGKTFRHEAYEEYKAKRIKGPRELYDQIPKTQEVVKSFDIPFFEKVGFEADDIIGSLAKTAETHNLDAIIVTGDMDELQLVTKNIKVFTMRRGFSDTVLYDEKAVLEKYGFGPEKLVDYKALRGDPSDNIPGVAGIGEKTATDLIKEFGTIENVYKNLSKIPEKIGKKLEAEKDTAFLSKRLAKIIVDMKIDFNLKKLKLEPFNQKKVVELFERFNFKSLIKRLFGEAKLDLDIPNTPIKRTKKKTHTLSAEEIDAVLDPVLKRMEKTGVLIDVKFLKKLKIEIDGKIKKTEKEIYKLVGHKFNINSPQQLASILFEELKLPPVKKIKTGFSTNVEVLNELFGVHPVIEKILTYREIFKLKTTYIDTLPQLVDKKNRVHTHYTQDTATGRLASRDPNLQNIPIRTELGQRIRKAFIAPPKFKLVGADYSQIELRIIASMAGDENMINSFKNEEDIHIRTASEINDLPIDKVTPEMRQAAKAINFGIIYGMSPFGLAKTLKISHEEAQNYIDKYFVLHSKILNYIEELKNLARENGYTETLFGRKRFVPELTSGYARFQNQAERIAINAPIQGTAADLIKMAMIEIDEELPKISSKSKMILQIHDELIFEAPDKDAVKVAQFVKEKMEKIYELKVPIKVEVSIGDNWGELK